MLQQKKQKAGIAFSHRSLQIPLNTNELIELKKELRTAWDIIKSQNETLFSQSETINKLIREKYGLEEEKVNKDKDGCPIIGSNALLTR